MAGVNKVIIVGNLGRDPEIKYTQQGLAIVTLAVATSESWTDKQSGQKQEKTEWHRITVFGKLGENCERYLSKGRQVYVEGRLQTSTYEKEGQTHYSTQIIASTVQFLGGKKDSGGQQGGQGGGGGYQPPQQRQAAPPNQGGGYQPQGGGGYQDKQQGGGYTGEPSPPPSEPPRNSEPDAPVPQPPEDDIPF